MGDLYQKPLIMRATMDIEQVKTDKLERLRNDIAQGLNEAKNNQTVELDLDSLKQKGRQLLKPRQDIV